MCKEEIDNKRALYVAEFKKFPEIKFKAPKRSEYIEGTIKGVNKNKLIKFLVTIEPADCDYVDADGFEIAVDFYQLLGIKKLPRRVFSDTTFVTKFSNDFPIFDVILASEEMSQLYDTLLLLLNWANG